MEPFDRPGSPRALAVGVELPAGSPQVEGVRSRRVRTPLSYRLCDHATEGLLYFMVIFAPWAFGTTQVWSIWTMNVAGYCLGLLLLGKWVIRWKAGFEPARWDAASPREELIVDPDRPGKLGGQIWTALLAALTGLFLLYCLISALNPRAIYFPDAQRFEYRDYIKWLPHSYDPLSTWEAFWGYLALACFFWSTRDWLLGKTARERRAGRDETQPTRAGESAVSGSIERVAALHVPDRLRRLLWVACLNGSILALECILQRLSGTNKLLWLVMPWLNSSSDAQFGPYAYRSNAASYFNLLWPVCVGFWLLLRRGALRQRRTGRVGSGSHVALLPCAVLMAAAPVISTARGGALIAFASILVVSFLVLCATRRESSVIRAGTLSLFVVILAFGGYLGWEQLSARLELLFVDQMSNRVEIYRNASPMVRDFPVFGTGPGTFGTIYRLYKEPSQIWEAYLHDDWLETRITFGWVGFGVILAALLVVAIRWFVPGGMVVPWEFVAMIWVSLGGCLTHAKFDFPLQVYSIQFLFLLVCSLLACVSRK